MPVYLYNAHQNEYDYSIISKDAKRMLGHRMPGRLIKGSENHK
jgi:CYTH domain-containing protein